METTFESINEPDENARVVSIDMLEPWPLNPRKTIGDLFELTSERWRSDVGGT